MCGLCESYAGREGGADVTAEEAARIADEVVVVGSAFVRIMLELCGGRRSLCAS